MRNTVFASDFYHAHTESCDPVCVLEKVQWLATWATIDDDQRRRIEQLEEDLKEAQGLLKRNQDTEQARFIADHQRYVQRYAVPCVCRICR